MDYKSLPQVVKMYEQYGVDEGEALMIIGFMSIELNNKLTFHQVLEKFRKEVVPLIWDLEGVSNERYEDIQH